MARRAADLVRWLFWCGVAGFLVACLFVLLGSLPIMRVSSWYIESMAFLWPASVLLIADPSTIGEKTLFLAVTFGANFLLYGLIGVLFRAFAILAERLLRRRSP